MTRAQAVPEGVGDVVGTTRAAEILGVTDRTIIRWADEGVLPVAYRTAGGHRRFKLADVRAAQETNPTEQE